MDFHSILTHLLKTKSEGKYDTRFVNKEDSVYHCKYQLKCFVSYTMKMNDSFFLKYLLRKKYCVINKKLDDLHQITSLRHIEHLVP